MRSWQLELARIEKRHKMVPEYAETIAAVSIGILSAIFISAFFILVLICRRQKMYKKALCASFDETTRPDLSLIKADNIDNELEDMQFRMDLEQILNEEQWVDHSTGLVPHCLSILKTCRSLTERLTALTLGAMNVGGNGLNRIVDSARTISSRVDDMVRCMYPPLDARLLEARAAALTLAVVHLALIAKYECPNQMKTFPWIDKALLEMEMHMSVLRDASLDQETSHKIFKTISSRAITTC